MKLLPAISRFCLALWPAAVLAAATPTPAVHPCLLLTPADVVTIRANLGHAPLFDAALAEARERMDRALAAPIVVPVPADAAGFTHETHKKNYAELQLAGLLYQLTGQQRYVTFAKAMLEQYAELYPKLGNHPAGTSSSPGRLFHQSLNDTVWLVNASQAYDCIYDALTPEERWRYETNIFRPMAHFLADERAEEFDRIHNHGTWAATAVGMAGFAMGDAELVKKALYGSKMNGAGGYLRQLDGLFSPDGYYVEGPYYARYALMPFFLFAEVIQHNQPDLKVFERRGGLLGKALDALLQQTYVNGEFFPINDALKEKTILSPDVVFTVDLGYERYGRDPRLLSVASRQQSVALSPAGFAVARALAATPQLPPFEYKSVEYRDGPDGTSGGLGILRHGSGNSESLALLKYTTFGMEHGHYDKLQFLYYDQGREIISDYGAARFLNVEQKSGGRYLPENKTFAKQTVAHNTVVVDGHSQYQGSYDRAEGQHSDREFYDASNPDFQVVNARDVTAYPGVTLQRTIAMVRDPRLAYPVVLDVFRVVSAEEHEYDLPCYYQGQFLKTNVTLISHTDEQRPLGKSDGYQHLWLEAEGTAQGPVQFTWITGNRYYSVTAAADPQTKLVLVRIGAHDPNFNLRHEPAFILQRRAKTHVFASAIEPHGKWDGTREVTSGGFPSLQAVRVLAATDEGTAVRVSGQDGLEWTLLISNQPTGQNGAHRLEAQGEVFTWTGSAALQRK